ncbi:MAG TPA: hypothetical protein VKB80_14005 [Kofleriaceae bacterium]|nr:hypothetical protein [Kofleriaceae bacterium]
MRSRAWLFGVVAAGVAAALILLLWPRSTSHDSEVTSAPAVTGGASSPTGPDRRAAPGEAGATADGAGPAEPAAEAQGGEPVDHDHRGETPTAPPRRRPGGRPVYVIQPDVIAGLRSALGPQIDKCGERYAADLEPDALIQASLRVAVHGGVVSVLDVEVHHRGVPESSGMIECARKALAAAELRADGHADVESHTLRLPFRISAR